MTLILTWLSQNRIIQVSDRRISYPNRHEDTARKCMLCRCVGAQLAISYTGGPVNFPEGGEVISIEDWLFREIGSLPAGILPGQMMYELTGRISTSYEQAAVRFNVPLERRKLSVVFAGFDLETKKPMLICTSNFEMLGTLLLSGQENELVLHRLSPSKPLHQFNIGAFTTSIAAYSGFRTRIVAHGNISILNSMIANSLHRRVRDIEERGLGHLAIRDILVDTIRQTVLRRGDGTVSKNCLSLSMYRDNELVDAGQHSLVSDEWVMPRVVGPGMQVEVWSYGDGINTRNIEKVGFLDEINTDTLRAYIETNDEAKYWTYCGGNDVTRLTFWGELQAAVRLAKLCGLKRIGDIHSLLVDAHGWGKTFLEKYYETLASKGHTALSNMGLTLHVPIMCLIVAANVERLSAEMLKKDFSFIDDSILDIALEIRGSNSIDKAASSDAA